MLERYAGFSGRSCGEQDELPTQDLDADGKPDYRIVTLSEVVSVYYDIRFTFEIVDGKRVVTPNV